MRTLPLLLVLPLVGCVPQHAISAPTSQRQLTLSSLPAIVPPSTAIEDTVPPSSVAVGQPPVPAETTAYVAPIEELAYSAIPGPAGSEVVGRCTQYEPLLAALQPPGGWDVVRFSKIMWKESRCKPDARSRTRDSGLLQINDIHIASLTAQFGSFDPFDPIDNIKAAAVLCEESRKANRACERPWGGTGQ